MNWETVITAIVSGSLGGFITLLIQERKLKQQYKLGSSAEKIAHELLQVNEWLLCLFPIIKHHPGGFEDNRHYL